MFSGFSVAGSADHDCNTDASTGLFNVAPPPLNSPPYFQVLQWPVQRTMEWAVMYVFSRRPSPKIKAA